MLGDSYLTGGESGSADTARDPRGFAVKLYTEEGNWDIVGNNTPIFFIRDPVLVKTFVLQILQFTLKFLYSKSKQIFNFVEDFDKWQSLAVEYVLQY